MSDDKGTVTPNKKTPTIRILLTEIFADPKFNTRQMTTGGTEDEETGKLSESFKRDGQLSPVVVHPYQGKKTETYKYELTAGFRRFAAANLLKWADIEAKVLDAAPSEADRKILNLVENMQRKDLAPFEFAEACHALVEGGMKGPEIAKRVGVSSAHVNNMVRLKKNLHPDLWKALRQVREGVRSGQDVTLQWLLTLASLPHAEQLAKLKEKVGEAGGDGAGSNGSGGGSGDGDAAPGIRAPSKKKVEEYLSALRTIPKEERSESYADVVKALKWTRGLLQNPPIKVKPQAEAAAEKLPDVIPGEGENQGPGHPRRMPRSSRAPARRPRTRPAGTGPRPVEEGGRGTDRSGGLGQTRSGRCLGRAESVRTVRKWKGPRGHLHPLYRKAGRWVRTHVPAMSGSRDRAAQARGLSAPKPRNGVPGMAQEGRLSRLP